ncbi:MAG: DUF2920 family protein [Armatimonadota bacterium]
MFEQDQEFVAQQWPFEPGARTVRMWVQQPPGGIGEGTGLMLCLHNWGGVYDEEIYRGWCDTFSARYDVVAVSVNYLQSGDEWKLRRDRPYDHGYLQAMDCIGALYHVRRQIIEAGLRFDEHRVYAMGGSGGGNVTQMVCKLAPRTLACGVDICGMPGLTDGIAFGTGEYGSHLSAEYSRDPDSPRYLSRDMQEIRDFGHPGHCRIRAEVNPRQKIVIVHGVDDLTCPVAPKIAQFRNMIEAGMDVDGRFLTEIDVDGEAVTTTGHAVGNRERVVIKYADEYLRPDGRLHRRTESDNDFQRGDVFEYPTTNGRYAIDYGGYPTIEFIEG